MLNCVYFLCRLYSLEERNTCIIPIKSVKMQLKITKPNVAGPWSKKYTYMPNECTLEFLRTPSSNRYLELSKVCYTS